MQIMPAPSMTCAAGASIFGPTATIAPSRTCTSPAARSGTAGSIVSTVTPRMSSSPRPGSGAPGALAVRTTCCADRPRGMSAAVPNAAAPCISARRLNLLPVICVPQAITSPHDPRMPNSHPIPPADDLNLFRLDVRRLDDRPPLLDLSPLLCCERLGRLFLARPDFLTHVGEPLAHRWIRQGVHECGMELGDNILRRALGRPKTMPKRRVKAGHPCFVDRWSIGRRRPPGLGHYRIGLELTGADLR